MKRKSCKQLEHVSFIVRHLCISTSRSRFTVSIIFGLTHVTEFTAVLDSGFKISGFRIPVFCIPDSKRSLNHWTSALVSHKHCSCINSLPLRIKLSCSSALISIDFSLSLIFLASFVFFQLALILKSLRSQLNV